MSGDPLFLSVRLRNFSQSSLRKKNQSWNKENGVTEIRTANPSSEIVKLPSRPRGTWRFRSVEERRRKKKTNNCSTFRAPRTHFSTLTITPTLTLTLTLTSLKYPNPNPNKGALKKKLQQQPQKKFVAVGANFFSTPPSLTLNPRRKTKHFHDVVASVRHIESRE